MDIYLRYDGKWVVVYGPNEGDEVAFDTYLEACMEARLENFVKAARDLGTRLAQVGDQVGDLQGVYLDRGYDAGLTDEDLVGSGITAAELTNLFSTLNQFQKLLNNQAVTTGEHRAVLNQIRLDK